VSLSHLFQALIEGFRTHRVLAGEIALISFGVGLIYTAVMFAAVARMSPFYFVAREPSPGTWRIRHPLLRRLAHVLKNVLGLLLLVVGVAMLALPGPGLLTALVALSLLDFPGKRKLVLLIVRRRRVRRSIDWIRRLAKQPPLVIPDPEG